MNICIFTVTLYSSVTKFKLKIAKMFTISYKGTSVNKFIAQRRQQIQNLVKELVKK